MAYEHILVAHDDQTATITMNRPQRRNALSESHMSELINAFRTIGEQRDVRIVIVAGNGPAFCAGHDLSEMVGEDHGDPAGPTRASHSARSISDRRRTKLISDRTSLSYTSGSGRLA